MYQQTGQTMKNGFANVCFGINKQILKISVFVFVKHTLVDGYWGSDIILLLRLIFYEK